MTELPNSIQTLSFSRFSRVCVTFFLLRGLSICLTQLSSKFLRSFQGSFERKLVGRNVLCFYYCPLTFSLWDCFKKLINYLFYIEKFVLYNAINIYQLACLNKRIKTLKSQTSNTSFSVGSSNINVKQTFSFYKFPTNLLDRLPKANIIIGNFSGLKLLSNI